MYSTGKFCLLIGHRRYYHLRFSLVRKKLSIAYRYDNTTGTFTAPPGGDGFYYFSVYLTMTPARFGFFDIQVNGEIICTAYGDTDDSTFVDTDHASCSAAALITEGIKLKL